MFLMQLSLCLALMLQAADTPLENMAHEVVEQISEQRQQIAAIYAKSLLQKASEDQLVAVYRGLVANHGLIVGITPQKRTLPFGR